MYLETGKKSASIIIEITGFSIYRDSVTNHRPLLLRPFAVPYYQVGLCAQWDTLCRVCCQVALPGQWRWSNWDLVLEVLSAKQSRPGAGTGHYAADKPAGICPRHRPCQWWSHGEKKQCLREKRYISSNERKHSLCSCHHSSVQMQN